MNRFRPVHLFFLVLCLPLSGIAFTDQAADQPADEAARDAAEADASKSDDKKSKIKPYDDVVTDEAVTRIGLFRTHRIEDKLLFEIPTATLGLDFLWVTQIAQTTAGNSYAGMPAGDRVIRWEQRGDRILLRDVRYGIRADTDDPIADAVKASNLAPIIRIFDVKAYGKDRAPVIDATELYTKEIPEFSGKRALNSGAMDTSRSFIEQVKAFPRNVDVRVLATFAAGKGDAAERSSGITAILHHSMVQLPSKPMAPRRFDSRVGFFSVGFVDYADDSEHQAEPVRFITRWRLEKKDLEADVSEPVKPIVFFVGREVPEKWKPFVKAGIEDWQPAFETAGFKNAIVGKYAPDPREDPDWDAEDARISSIRWLPSDIENAFGPHVHDPRTGEILEADVRMYHNVQKLVRDWYFVQASPNDERAQELPMPDSLMGELIRFVVAHEVGHSLGFPHNMKASSSYSVDQLRDAEFTRENGTSPSIMDYARFNYVAQPGDNAALMPKVGPYDHFAVNWGYRQFQDNEDEKQKLEEIVQVQVDDPVYRFGGRNPAVDSTQQTEDLGSDAVEATRLGLKNLERVAGYLVEATTDEGENYDLLTNMFEQLLRQWIREMGHVVNVVGGVQDINLYHGDAARRFFSNSPRYQRRAVDFLVEHALATPAMFHQPDIVLRITAGGVADRILAAQTQVIRGLLDRTRINRMTEHLETGRPPGENETGFSAAELMEMLREGVFSECAERPVEIDLFRRNLQRAFIEHLITQLNDAPAASDLPALARSELVALERTTDRASDTAKSPVVRAHLHDLAARIGRALRPNGSD